MIAGGARLTRSARDLSRAAGAPLSRRTLDYVVKALLAVDESQLTAPGRQRGPVLADRFAGQTIQRMVDLRILDDDVSEAAAEVRRWIAGPMDP